MDLKGSQKIFGDFKINNKNGISIILQGQVELEDIINHTSIPGLDVITSFRLIHQNFWWVIKIWISLIGWKICTNI